VVFLDYVWVYFQKDIVCIKKSEFLDYVKVYSQQIIDSTVGNVMPP
jgi:hypothetical protein